ncbi:MAG: transketolase C-terminal domain-containing protein [Myxococcota bacterium]
MTTGLVDAVGPDRVVDTPISEYAIARTHGFGSEVAARAGESLFDALRAAPRRVAGADVPIPYASSLEGRCVPDVGRIVEAIRATVGGG